MTTPTQIPIVNTQGTIEYVNVPDGIEVLVTNTVDDVGPFLRDTFANETIPAVHFREIETMPDMSAIFGRYYCPSCRRHYNNTASESECVKCGTQYNTLHYDHEHCPECGHEEYENICVGCGLSGAVHGLDFNECWRPSGGEVMPTQIILEVVTYPLHPQWVRDIASQCEAAGVPFLFVGWGDWAPAENFPKRLDSVESAADIGFWQDDMFWIEGGYSSHGQHMVRLGFNGLGAKSTGRTIDGRTYDGVPDAVKEAVQSNES